MKKFDEWIRTGPLNDEQITDRERTLLNIAYLEGASAAIEDQLAQGHITINAARDTLTEARAA